jgi:hypothetical protein
VSTRRRSPGEGGAYSYKIRSGAGPSTRWYWKAVVKEPDGTERAKVKRGFETKKAALDDMHEALRASRRQGYAEPSKRPVGAYLTEWLAGQTQLRPSTAASYRKNIRLHLDPHIGDVPLASLTSTRISALYRQLETSGRADHREGESLSARTVRYVAMILSSALAEAVETGRLARSQSQAADR